MTRPALSRLVVPTFLQWRAALRLPPDAPATTVPPR
jgi:hypothetical protein